MTKLSVNINKIALIRNARGENLPDIFQAAKDIESFGADGITVHPRPDERHIKYSDIPILKKVVTREFNIEGYPSKKFMDLVLANKPHQCTLVPDPPGVLTSNTGWDTIKHRSFLQEITRTLQKEGIRVSLFLNPSVRQVRGAQKTGADRIELYTGPYASMYPKNREKAIEKFAKAALEAKKLGLGLNAGHDLNLDNLAYFKQNIAQLLEVSIGHALISDCLYFGLNNTIKMYQRLLE